MIPNRHAREQERLAALRSYGILDTPREADFDDVVKILADVCDAPFSTITLIDEERQWHKAAVGIGDLRETHRDVAFLLAHHPRGRRHADRAQTSPRTRASPTIRSSPAIPICGSTPGALLRDENGLPLGTVCVVDYKPRATRRTPDQHPSAHGQAGDGADRAAPRTGPNGGSPKSSSNFLIAELHHRVKNTLATVQAVIHIEPARRARHGQLPRQHRPAHCLACGHAHAAERTALGRRVIPRSARWRTGALRTRRAPRRSTGPDFKLPAQTAVALGMVLHELTTNASKYGALSCDEGRLAVSWNVAPGDAEQLLALDWRESHGPPVSAPAREGFGTNLLRRIIADHSGGKVEFSFKPDRPRSARRGESAQGVMPASKRSEIRVLFSCYKTKLGRVRRPHPLRAISPPFSRSTTAMSYWLCKIEPELRGVAEIAAEPHRRVGGDRAAAVEDVGDAAGRHAEVERQPVGAQAARPPARASEGGRDARLELRSCVWFSLQHDILLHRPSKTSKMPSPNSLLTILRASGRGSRSSTPRASIRRSSATPRPASSTGWPNMPLTICARAAAREL